MCQVFLRVVVSILTFVEVSFWNLWHAFDGISWHNWHSRRYVNARASDLADSSCKSQCSCCSSSTADCRSCASDCSILNCLSTRKRRSCQCWDFRTPLCCCESLRFAFSATVRDCPTSIRSSHHRRLRSKVRAGGSACEVLIEAFYSHDFDEFVHLLTLVVGALRRATPLASRLSSSFRNVAQQLFFRWSRKSSTRWNRCRLWLFFRVHRDHRAWMRIELVEVSCSSLQLKHRTWTHRISHDFLQALQDVELLRYCVAFEVFQPLPDSFSPSLDDL